MEAVRDAAGEHEGPRSKPLARTRRNLDELVARADVIHAAPGADRATRLRHAGRERTIKPGAVQDGNLLARILEFCHAAAR